MNICLTCRQQFETTARETEFIQKMSPVIGNQHFEIPQSPFCPDCRRITRTIHRNEQFLYKNVSAKTGQPLVSIYAPDNNWRAQFPIYSHEEWWSEDWDAMSYGRDYDFSRPFFDQYYELSMSVPRVALIQFANENCPFTTGTGYCKNCHLISCSENSQDCCYGKLIQTCSNVVDGSYVYDSELLYQCFNVRNCYNCAYLYYSQNCTDCFFSENLVGCKNCFLSTNLRNKEFYFMNKPMKKAEYEQEIKKYFGSKSALDEALQILSKMRQERIHKYTNVVNSENSSGDFLMNCQNCENCYDVNDSQDCYNLNVGVNVKDCYECSNMYLKSELCYQVLGTIEAYNCLFSLFIFHCQNVLYSQFCNNSSNLFGCFGLLKKQYCIFNKQYTKEEYERLVPKIIESMKDVALQGSTGMIPDGMGSWGLMFPAWMSPFAYNESLAYEFKPLTQEQSAHLGFQWHASNPRENKPATVTLGDSLSENAATITKELLCCEQCGKNYKIIEQELAALKRMNMPIPRMCHDCRHFERLKLRNSERLNDRECDKCGTSVQSTFAQQNSAKIYCEKCYLGEF